MKRVGRIAAALVLLGGQVACTQRPENVTARYVSPVGYRVWTCDQLLDERARLISEVDRVAGLQRENANADAAMMTVGIILLWPVLFGLAATTDRREELGRLRGEYEAVEASRREKACPAPAAVPPPPPPAPNA